MKKVFLNCIYEENLGDDLLIKQVCERYKNTLFIHPTYFKSKNKCNISNLKIIKVNEYIYRGFRKLGTKLNKLNIIDKIIMKNCDYIVTVGGSMFIEYKNQCKDYKFIWYKNLSKPYYIIGTNIGPVYTKKYLLDLQNIIFKNAQDVCVRDKKSYDMIKKLENVRLSTDIVFSYDMSKYKNKKTSQKVVISIINCERKKSQMRQVSQEKYEKKILEIIEFFKRKNYEVELFSFCKHEGDEDAIKRILKEVNDNSINYYFYDGNIDKALEELNSAKIIVGTRFHANVLGLLLEKTILPIIYNDKTRNLLEDINFKGKYIDMEKLDEFDIQKITDQDLEYKCDVSQQISQAQHHFLTLDQVLER